MRTHSSMSCIVGNYIYEEFIVLEASYGIHLILI